jgi:hypothetical protein
VEEQQNKSTMMRNGKLALKGLTKEEKIKLRRQERRTKGKGETKRMEIKISLNNQKDKRKPTQNLNT